MNNNSSGNSSAPNGGTQPPQYYQQQMQYPPNGQYQQPQQYPPNEQYQQSQQYPPNGQYQQPQQYPPNGQCQQPQQYPPNGYYQQPQQYPPNGQCQQPQQYSQQGVYYMPPPNYPMPVYYYLSPEQINKQLFKRHCSRVGFMLMADTGIMLVAQITIMLVGFIGYLILSDKYFPWLDVNSAAVNVTMFAAGISAIIAHMIPARAHGHKWRIKFADPFRGDKLSKGFIAAATVTALGLNAMWGYIYYFYKDWLNDALGVAAETTPEGYTPATIPLVGFILMVIWSCVIAPITEEYMFRGIILRTLSKHGAAFGIVISAMLFGLMHGNMAQTPMTFMLGLIMGYVAAKSGNIRQTVFMHMVNNIFATVPEIVMYSCPQYYDYLEYMYLVIDLISIVFAICSLIYFAVKHHKGIKARRLRLQSGATEISKSESDWARLEISEERRTPQFNLVRNKFSNCFASGGMIFFVVFMLLMIFMSDVLPYLLPPLIKPLNHY